MDIYYELFVNGNNNVYIYVYDIVYIYEKNYYVLFWDFFVVIVFGYLFEWCYNKI